MMLALFLRYKVVIDACSLQPDIDLLPFGDQTDIGERVCTRLLHSSLNNSLLVKYYSFIVYFTV